MNHSKQSSLSETGESHPTSEQQLTRAAENDRSACPTTGNYARVSHSRELPATPDPSSNPRTTPDTSPPRVRGAALPATTPPTRPLPPRPAPTATAPKPRPIIKAHSEPPPGDCTRAYDQRQLSRLLLETDQSIDSKRLGTYYAKDSARNLRAVQEIPTVRPAASNRSDPSTEVSLARARKDTIPDDEDLTTAYVRHDSEAASGAGLRAGHLPPSHAQNGNASTPVAARDTEEILSFAALSEELELSKPQSTADGTQIAARSVSTPSPEAPVLERKPDEISSERTGPQLQRLSSARPAPVPPRSSVQRRVLRGLLIIGAIGLVLTAIAHRGKFGYDSARAQIHRQWIQAHRVIARVSGRTPPVQTTSAASVRLIEVNVVVEPPEAQLYLDGRTASNPLRVAYPADGAMHVLRAEAEGRKAVTQSVKFDRDISVVLGLGLLSPEVPADPP